MKRGLRAIITGLVFITFVLAGSQSAYATTGFGDSIIELTKIKKPVLVQLSHQGASNFIVWAKDKNASRIDLVANNIGNYSGTILLNLNSQEVLNYFEITADGSWSVEVKGLKKAPNWKGKTYSGFGDQVIELQKIFKGNTRLNLSHIGSGNFIVWTYDKNGKRLDLKANEIGSYTGQKFLGSNVKYISVQSDGEWTIGR
jgi:hypothetical protein